MNPKTTGIRLPQVKSFCNVFPDSCIILNHVFSEEEFRPKIEYFSKKVTEGISCEMLPQVNVEIAKKLFSAANEYVLTLRRCKEFSRSVANQSLDEVFVVKETAEILEQAFIRVFSEISRKHFPTFAQKDSAIRRARIVETAVMLEFGDAIDRSEKTTLSAFLFAIENNLKNKYIEFCDKQSLYMQKLNIKLLRTIDILQTAKGLEETLRKCGVRNRNDVRVLCQAIGRMYKINKWCLVTTTDYGDLIRNKALIEKLSQLVVSDPLYFLYHLDKKIDCALHPKDGVKRMKIRYDLLIEPPPDIGIV